MLFEDTVQVLDHVFAALFGERGHGDAHNFPVIHWIEAQIGSTNGFFDACQRGRIERLDGDHLGLRRVDGRDLIERHLLAEYSAVTVSSM